MGSEIERGCKCRDCQCFEEFTDFERRNFVNTTNLIETTLLWYVLITCKNLALSNLLIKLWKINLLNFILLLFSRTHDLERAYNFSLTFGCSNYVLNLAPSSGCFFWDPLCPGDWKRMGVEVVKNKKYKICEYLPECESGSTFVFYSLYLCLLCFLCTIFLCMSIYGCCATAYTTRKGQS